MSDAFQEIDGQETAPENIKEMLVSEIDVIRDTMQIVQLFLGQFLVAGVTMIQEFEPQKKK